jgi:hypothetical protein
MVTSCFLRNYFLKIKAVFLKDLLNFFESSRFGFLFFIGTLAKDLDYFFAKILGVSAA